MKQVRIIRPAGLSRIARARVVRDEVMKQSGAHGRWECLEVGEGRQARMWRIDTGCGWEANVWTRFTLKQETAPKVSAYDEALLLQLAPPRMDDVVLDLYVAPFSKVLSFGTTAGVDTLISMQPGPWEEMFGLESRPWPASIARRLASQAARVQVA